MKVGTRNLIGRLIGALLLAGAIAAAFLYEVKPQEDERPEPIRPIKSVRVGVAEDLPTLYFPGTVDADSQVDLSFQVAGRLIEFPAVRGTRVKQGDLLAKLDQRDYENQVKDAAADLKRAQSSLSRIEKALESQAVSQEDFSRALAERNKAQANLEIKMKALEETELNATFDGVVADTYVDNFDNIAAGEPILKLMDFTALTITISLSQEYMLIGASSETLKNSNISVVFDWLPGISCPARLKNFATTVDPITRTYEATFHIEKAEDVLLLPGIAGTVVIDRYINQDSSPLVVPADAVGFDSNGDPFVWVLAEDTDGNDIYLTSRRTIVIGKRIGQLIEVTDGMERGTRIAAAGVSLLSEGRKVHLLQTEAETDR